MLRFVDLSDNKGEVTFDNTLDGLKFFMSVRDASGKSVVFDYLKLDDLRAVRDELDIIIQEGQEQVDYMLSKGVEID